MTAIPRHKTAIRRNGPSRPLKLLLAHGLLNEETSFFDYGCGHGEDVDHLREQGIEAHGWDPFHRGDADRFEADVVGLTYVINVIEDAADRAETLRAAWKLVDRALIVSALVTGDQSGKYDLPYEDGYVTSLGTFQKYYTQSELHDYIVEVLGEVELRPLALGVFIVFRCAEQAERYELARFRRRLKVRLERRTNGRERDLERHIEPLYEFMIDRGRFPRNDEANALREDIDALGGMTRARRLMHMMHGDAFAIVRELREEDILLFLALSRFKRRKVRLKHLPSPDRADIKTFFGSLKKANATADFLLHGLGEDGTIRDACRAASYGKLMPDALYVHADYVNRLPFVLRLYEGLARRYIGTVDGATIVKLHHRTPKVSYLFYPRFDEDAHPALAFAINASLRDLEIRFLDFRDRENPPILHRKELFVGEDYPHFDKFTELTQAEEEAGLYYDTSQIGLRNGWKDVLTHAGVRLEGHHVVPADE